MLIRMEEETMLFALSNTYFMSDLQAVVEQVNNCVQPGSQVILSLLSKKKPYQQIQFLISCETRQNVTKQLTENKQYQLAMEYQITKNYLYSAANEGMQNQEEAHQFTSHQNYMQLYITLTVFDNLMNIFIDSFTKLLWSNISQDKGFAKENTKVQPTTSNVIGEPAPYVNSSNLSQNCAEVVLLSKTQLFVVNSYQQQSLISATDYTFVLKTFTYDFQTQFTKFYYSLITTPTDILALMPYELIVTLALVDQQKLLAAHKGSVQLIQSSLVVEQLKSLKYPFGVYNVPNLSNLTETFIPFGIAEQFELLFDINRTHTYFQSSFKTTVVSSEQQSLTDRGLLIYTVDPQQVKIISIINLE
ncbi:Hypothetical_protein [Hexamita inflata]|uniref:Hypothetical_protein n=1 Tax=Hexamita inflata TaxID=28002 RepID=A0ABP1HGJ0_9EUKA